MLCQPCKIKNVPLSAICLILCPVRCDVKLSAFCHTGILTRGDLAIARLPIGNRHCSVDPFYRISVHWGEEARRMSFVHCISIFVALALKWFFSILFIVLCYIQYDYIHSAQLCRPTGHEDWHECSINMLGLHTWVRFSYDMGGNATDFSGTRSYSVNLHLDDLDGIACLFGIFDHLLDSLRWWYSSKVCIIRRATPQLHTSLTDIHTPM